MDGSESEESMDLMLPIVYIVSHDWANGDLTFDKLTSHEVNWNQSYLTIKRETRLYKELKAEVPKKLITADLKSLVMFASDLRNKIDLYHSIREQFKEIKLVNGEYNLDHCRIELNGGWEYIVIDHGRRCGVFRKKDDPNSKIEDL